MPVTSLKLPEALKARVAAAAAESGKSAHAFMVEAIERQTRIAELRAQFVGDALAAERETVESGRAYRADDVHRYIVAKAAKRRVARPRAKAWR
jgi:predicted transcriptional regulator